MKYAALSLLLFLTYTGHSQVFWTEDFDGAPCGLPGNSGCDPSIVGWNVTITGAEGGAANRWYVSDQEAGNLPPACGSAGGGDKSLHIGNVSTSSAAILFCPSGDCGAAYDDSSPNESTDKRAESPIIDCSGQVGTITLDFNYLENGQGTIDDMTLWYRDGAAPAWTQIDPIPKSALGCAPQGQWTAYSVVLPATSSGNADVQIGFRWVNVGDGGGADPSCAVDDLSLTLTVTAAPPVAAFSSTDSTLCENDCIDFTDLSTSTAVGGITAWSWDFGNGQTSTSPNPTSICYATAGSYTVTLTVTDANGNDTDTQTNFIVVSSCATPVAAFSSTDSTLCENDCIDFTDLSTSTAPGGITAWSWDFGNGQTSTSPNPTNICYATAGNYTVTLTVTDANGNDTDTQTNFIVVSSCATPVTAFSSTDSTLCENDCVDFTDLSTSTAPGGITAWSWDFGNGQTSSSPNPTNICYAASGNYTVTLTVTDANGSDTETQVDFIVVSVCGTGPPVAAFSASDSTLCPGDCIDFTDLSTSTAPAGITTWSWNFGNGQTSTLPNPVGICYPTAGNYTVSLTVTDANGFDTEVQVNFIVVSSTSCGPPPVAAFSSSDSTFCLGNCIDFTDLSTSTAVSGITSWVWDFGDGQTSNLSNPTSICYAAAGTYTVSLTVTDVQGSDTEVLASLIEVLACSGPTSAFTVDNASPCLDSCVNFTDASTTTAAGGIAAWEWSFPGGTPASHSGQFPPAICYATSGSFDVELITTDVDGSDTLTQTAFITVNTPISIPVSGDTTIMPGDSVGLVSGAGFTNYLWSPGDSLSCTSCQNTVASPLFTTVYTISAEDVNGCLTSDSVVVTVTSLPDTLYIPNVFTPNGDGINDQFRVTAPVDFRLQIYNRWGQVIYTSDLQPYWDGRTNTGDETPSGTYYYVIELISGETYTGFLTLKR